LVLAHFLSFVGWVRSLLDYAGGGAVMRCAKSACISNREVAFEMAGQCPATRQLVLARVVAELQHLVDHAPIALDPARVGWQFALDLEDAHGLEDFGAEAHDVSPKHKGRPLLAGRPFDRFRAR
jgi:hypothetical protein